MREMCHGRNGLCSILAKRYDRSRRYLNDLEADRALQMGFSVLASIPQTDTVYPLLGRPHDSLDGPGHGDG